MNSHLPNTPLLDSISNHEDLKSLHLDELPALAEEVRRTLIAALSVTGGHLGPNLGVVELSIALHRVFETPIDKVLFDVSHQSYVHKMLTGRADRIHTIRQHAGLSGFMKRNESPHDVYGAGHAGTALSAALGICAARDLKGQDYSVIAVAGDAAFTCGTTLEALNNISHTTQKLIVVLNDNEWAIDKNVGALANYFTALQTSEKFSWLRKRTAALVSRVSGLDVTGFAAKIEDTAKSLIFPTVIFHKFGLRYLGPIDGHDINLLIKTLEFVKTVDNPVIIHIVTEKGRGYQPALDDPTKFHGVGMYSVEDGGTAGLDIPTYSEVFGRTMVQLAHQDESVVAITAAMPSGTKLDLFKNAHPKRYYDVGIAEEHAAVFACGMAAEGLKPYVAIYSTFMQRCIDMVQHDAALQKLPVRFCMDRAGLSPDDGPTHHGVFDIAMLRCIPDLVLMQPKDEAELVNMLYTMNAYQNGASAIRYPRGVGLGVPLPSLPEILPIGRAEVILHGDDVVLLALGNMVQLASQVAAELKTLGVSPCVINARFVKPLDSVTLAQYARGAKLLVTLEDHSIEGGFGSAVLEALEGLLKQGNLPSKPPVELIGWPDSPVEHGTESILREKYGLTMSGILARIKHRLSI